MQAAPPPLMSPSGSRNDVFQANWKVTPPPALTPPRTPARTPPLSIPRRKVFEYDPPDRAPPVFSFGPTLPPPHTTPADFHTSPPTSKTSSFFASSANTPPPPPRLRETSPTTSLSRKASVRSARSVSLQHSPPDLTPLHQSPSLPPTTWTPPQPPAAEDITLRFSPEPSYLLGEGRYAAVYLASYKQTGNWTLCAAKRLAPDRESQTMGLREAFFLNRLTAGPGAKGQVYIVKLIAVKEDESIPPVQGHARTVSELVDAPRRQRASTIYAGGRQDTGSHPSLPALAESASPAASRLVLVLEHAPLGTLDRLLRSSPHLVGEDLWGRWAREASEALAWVHAKGVIHADVKPSNLLLTTDLHLRLSDFGSSLLIHPSHPPTDGVGLGTLPFSAPELVDPTTPFGFAVDIFALGATLYQCLTGREPYRGSRPVEMMHHVRKGGLWAWLERERLARIGAEESAPASPYPSAWRGDPVPEVGVRRSGSLRVPLRQGSVKRSPLREGGEDQRPKLMRVGSAESIQASVDAEAEMGDSPPGVRLWAAWQRGGGRAIDWLLREGEDGVGGGEEKLPRSPSSPQSPWIKSPVLPQGGHMGPAYEDGAPAMFYLSGEGRVDGRVREVLRGMLEALEEDRPSADELVGAWDSLGVGREGSE